MASTSGPSSFSGTSISFSTAAMSPVSVVSETVSADMAVSSENDEAPPQPAVESSIAATNKVNINRFNFPLILFSSYLIQKSVQATFYLRSVPR